MSEVKAELFADGCNQQLPAWGVTRQFEFGQFVLLYDYRMVKGKPVSTPIVLSQEGDIVIEEPNSSVGTLPKNYSSGGVPIQLLYQTDRAVELMNYDTPTNVVIKNIEDFLHNEAVTDNGVTFSAKFSNDSKAKIASGLPVTIIGHVRKGEEEKRISINFVPHVNEVVVKQEELNEILARGEYVVQDKKIKLGLTTENVQALLSGVDTVVGSELNGVKELMKFRILEQEQKPAVNQLEIKDLAEFIANPKVLGNDGRSIPINLKPDILNNLRTTGRAVVEARNTKVELALEAQNATVGKSNINTKLSNYPIVPDFQSKPVKWWGNILQQEINNRKRNGLQLAILLPWQQNWKLEGFSRGTLLSTIALAPGEETAISISSWENRAKALDQSTETEVDQQVDFTQTTRDTEDVFKEMTNRNEFQSQIHGNIDASYATTVASISVGVDGGVTNSNSLSNVMRMTNNHLREVTSRASTKVRSKRITKITESVEQGYSEQVSRVIKNPNECRTLTLDYHETLAHYNVSTRFISNNVRIVVLIPNPISTKTFSPLLIRKNETALRNALLDPALADGFDACRLLTSYEFAKDELKRVSTDNKKIEEQDRDRIKDKDKLKPENPYENMVIDLLKEIVEIAEKLLGAKISSALTAIGKHNKFSDDVRTSGQQWMFIRLCKVKITPAFVNTLSNLVAKKGSIGIGDVQSILDVVPGPGAYPSLSDLNDLPDTDKEQAGLDVEIKSQPGYIPWDWGWWTSRCREESLYRVNDGGLAAKIKRLGETWQDYLAKNAEGEGIMQGSQITENAQENQDKANYMDKLEMKYGLEIVASARERMEALLGHLNDHIDYYCYVLFQALPPGEQLHLLMTEAPQLQVGTFEPHVVAMTGKYLAIPLTPLGATKLEKTLSNLKDTLKKASDDATATAEVMGDNHVILPTPGVTVESRLGQCSGCEDHVEQIRSAEVRKAIAEARLAELEADHMAARLGANPPQLDPPVVPSSPVIRVQVDGDEMG